MNIAALIVAAALASATHSDKPRNAVRKSPDGRPVVTNLDTQADPMVGKSKDGRPAVNNPKEKPLRARVEEALRDAGKRISSEAGNASDAIEKQIKRWRSQ